MSYHGGGGGRGGGGGGGGPRNNDNDAEDAEQKAAEKNLIRKCVDYHTPGVIDTSNRLYSKACRTAHVRNRIYLEPHSSYLRLMGMPISQASAPNPSVCYLTFLAHVTRAKNSTPVMCLSWTPGGRRLLTGNQEGEFTLWDGITFGKLLSFSPRGDQFVWLDHRKKRFDEKCILTFRLF